MNPDISDLLIHTKSEIELLTQQSNNGEINKVSLKNILENLRSILDYHSEDISIKLKEKQISVPDKVYFPYEQRENHFKKSIDKNLPKLKKINNNLYTVIENAQPFKAHDNWIIDLCSLTNEAKHNHLSKTENQKSVTVRQGNFIHIEGGRNITLYNNYANGVRLDDVFVDNNGEVNIVKHSDTTLVIEKHRIMFDGKSVEVIPFLNKCHEKMTTLTENITEQFAKF
ncbi:hypothetical protein [Shewanella sedimentimangrovi]|uniref:Uncharacterized protein n=1 Tax=Shewanella sedimentimangrovi TaxID=2814293 RepID=A0ABX7R066_9GAMM|nr:hypothetical protein [Shewanella sedimentimangrovi]QSX36495.1 hypothetical protein JYB85_14560 [Shewanella sedimentimangrovi]